MYSTQRRFLRHVFSTETSANKFKVHKTMSFLTYWWKNQMLSYENKNGISYQSER